MKKGRKKKLKVGLIFGGRSAEHEVSLVSAESVYEALDRQKYRLIPIYLSHQGKLFTGSDIFAKAKKKQTTKLKKFPISLDPKKQNLNLVFPLIHGSFGEDGCLQGLLEMIDLPYVGAGVMASAVAMDKIITKRLWQEAGLPII